MAQRDENVNHLRNTTYRCRRCRRCGRRLLLLPPPTKKTGKNKHYHHHNHQQQRRRLYMIYNHYHGRHQLRRIRRYVKKLGTGIFTITKSILLCLACILQIDDLF
jgi:hypothetical protein